MRSILLIIALAIGQVAFGQAPQTDEAKLEGHFTLNLSPRHDVAVSIVAQSIAEHDALLRAEGLRAANAPLISKALDLLRYLPIRFNAGEKDEFALPNYLRADYAVPVEADLFAKP